jgi:hypothetical protein
VLHVDNQALVAAINKGSCRQQTTQAIIRKIYTLAAWKSFFFQAHWISTKDNKRADDLSRFISAAPAPATTMGLSGHDFDPDHLGDLPDDSDEPEMDDISRILEQCLP